MLSFIFFICLFFGTTISQQSSTILFKNSLIFFDGCLQFNYSNTNCEGYSNVFYIYNFNSNSWSSIKVIAASYSTYPSYFYGNNFFQNYVIFYNGQTINNNYVDEIYLYNSNSNSWSSIKVIAASYSTYPSYYGNNFFQNYVIFYNGQTINNNYVDEIYLYNSNSNSWSSITVSATQYLPIGIGMNNTLFVNSNFSQMFLYNSYPNTFNALSLPSSAIPSTNINIILTQNDVLFYYQIDNSYIYYSNEVYVYRYSSNVWSSITVTAASYTTYSFYYDGNNELFPNYVIFYNGQNTNNNYVDEIYLFNSNSNSWSSITITAAFYNIYSFYSDQNNFTQNYVIFYNGRTINNSYLDKIYLYNINSNSLTSFSVFPSSSYSANSLENTDLIVITNNNGNHTYFYNYNSGIWTTNSFFNSYYSYQVAQYGNILLFFNNNYNDASNIVYIYNISSNTWSSNSFIGAGGYQVLGNQNFIISNNGISLSISFFKIFLISLFLFFNLI